MENIINVNLHKTCNRLSKLTIQRCHHTHNT